MLGPLEKMKILAFKDADRKQPALPPSFPVLVNPESYGMEHAVEYDVDETVKAKDGTESTSTLKYKKTPPGVFTCELHFDASGILDGIARPDVIAETELFKKFLLSVEPETHDMRHFTIIWGAMIFKGRVTALNYNFKLFSNDGRPIRAVAEVSFKGSFSDKIGELINHLLSPDLTHRRVVRAGDTLANLCQEVYGNLVHLQAVARHNELNSYRSLPVGRTLSFPPIKSPAR
ncbi:CIS tube protein [Neolewinella persica]|uniref:CIS tube protein n=1 Tax=Neolewinella persica TaxID=70998 RepID=UPI00036A0FF5|nr:LysM peptidoglycan-binding domain-containing protein [Neolewinella persica]